ncbi:DUF4380 domain-containing protein [Gilvimarinus sp. DA14]|uniref:DUF4380 domain-containing protein n=1 Tax=Gilvimarinus sp. DA14 TaxID=2956798 RepID=UPI0020B8EF0F|nr:DUF4380 domain-containing protein [Gilvimarinus sp. DA14]UTF61113.1 DUF4380 domain-containing protein [Gilvimarinus sp. DA14]
MRRTLLLASLLCLSACEKQAPTQAQVTPPDYLRMGEKSIVLERDDLKVTLAPAVGGRIASVEFNGKERLFTRAGTDGNNWGNVLWPSPQSRWGWPPPEVLDSAPYRVSLTDTGVTLHSDTQPGLGLAFSKSYRVASVENTLQIDYQLHNRGTKEITFAPWEITRLPAQGHIFFPQGETEYFTGDFSGLPFQERQGISYYRYNADDIGPEHHKVMTDGEEGWLAYHNGDFLLVKVFANVPAELIAPNEGEIEIYADPTATYIELEQQGYLATLQVGETLNWQVLWVFTEVEADATLDELTAQARQLAGLVLSGSR